MNRCPDCRNLFVQPFTCTTCGAQKLYDETVRSLHGRCETLEARLAEACDLLTLAAGVALLPSDVPALPLAIRERIAAWLRAQEPPR